MRIVIIFNKVTDTFYFLLFKFFNFSVMDTYYFFKKTYFFQPEVHSFRARLREKNKKLIPLFHTPLPSPSVTMVESLMCLSLGLSL